MLVLVVVMGGGEAVEVNDSVRCTATKPEPSPTATQRNTPRQ